MSLQPGGMLEEWLRQRQQQFSLNAQQNPVQNFNPEMMAANASVPNPQFAGSGLGGMARRGAIGLQNGLGKLQQAMFPIDSTQAAGMSAEDIRNYRNQAMMKMGLGMMGSASQGAGAGEALMRGYGLAQGGMNEQLQQRMQNARVQKQDQRVETRDAIEDERYAAEDAYRREQNAARMEMERQVQEESRRRFEENLVLDKRGLGLQERSLDLRGSGLGRQLLTEDQLKEMGFKPGSIVQMDGKGGLKVLQQGGDKIPEGTQRSMSYLSRMQNAEKNLAENGYTPQGLAGAANIAASMVPGGNFLVSGNFQKYQASAREWISGVLRYDSGAAVPDSEFNRYFNTWFAQPGDGPETIEQKEQMRGLMAQAMETGLPEEAIKKMAQGHLRNRGGATGRWSIEEID